MPSNTGSLTTRQSDDKAARRSRAAEIALRELRHFGTVFLYLAVVFGVFALHQFVVLANNGMSYTFYGASLINAAILAKIIHVAEALHFGESFENKPLAFPILYKSVAFGLLLVVAYVVEEVVVGLIRGHSLAQSMPELGGGTLAGLAAVAVIMSVALIPFFAFKEIRRAYGEAHFDSLLFKRR
jgi:hypothetical protein